MNSIKRTRWFTRHTSDITIKVSNFQYAYIVISIIKYYQIFLVSMKAKTEAWQTELIQVVNEMPSSQSQILLESRNMTG